jgi:glycerol-3-phosphate dehydrogenase
VNPVLILGAGINGCAVARDLAINGIPVVVVDKNDIAYGATSRSSRLIHGGLRYLEYRDIRLVRESLRERERLLSLAPQFVRPIRLSIPIQNRFGGLFCGALNFLGLGNTRLAQWAQRKRGSRGLWAVRAGLTIYDALADGSTLPRRSFQRTVAAGQSFEATPLDSAPPALSSTMRWVYQYSDAQMELPERFCLSLLHDAQQAAREQGAEFSVFTRHEATFVDRHVLIQPVSDGEQSAHAKRVCSDRFSYISAPIGAFGAQINQPVVAPTDSTTIEPCVVVNATGASGDLTLAQLGVEQPTMFAGTKGTHLFTINAALKMAIGDNGIYAEAQDGRLVFILPCDSGVLIGTTDDQFQGTAEQAVATSAEVDYLIGLVHDVFPSVALSPSDIEMAHAGVRPLPRADAKRTSDIPRGHAITMAMHQETPIYTLIGGKLTTCRSLAEEVTDEVLRYVQEPRKDSTLDRPVPGGSNWPTSESAHVERIAELGTRYGLTTSQVNSVLRLAGDRFEEVFASADDSRTNICGTEIPAAFAIWSANNEWVATLDDLAERRLALMFTPNLGRSTLVDLAHLLVQTGKLAADKVEAAVDKQISRFEEYYSKTVLRDR